MVLDLFIILMVEKVINIIWSGGVFCYCGEFVDFVRIKIVFVDFLEWLENFFIVVIVVYNG